MSAPWRNRPVPGQRGSAARGSISPVRIAICDRPLFARSPHTGIFPGRGACRVGRTGGVDVKRAKSAASSAASVISSGSGQARPAVSAHYSVSATSSAPGRAAGRSRHLHRHEGIAHSNPLRWHQSSESGGGRHYSATGGRHPPESAR
jgi:hypothetical protein